MQIDRGLGLEKQQRQFGYGISFMVGPREQDFLSKVCIGTLRKSLYFENTMNDSLSKSANIELLK